MFDSTRIIGEKQFSTGKVYMLNTRSTAKHNYFFTFMLLNSLKDLYENANNGLAGTVDFVHTNVDFSSVSVTVNGEQVLYTAIFCCHSLVNHVDFFNCYKGIILFNQKL